MTIEEMVQHDDVRISKAAEHIRLAKEAYEGGQISQLQYKELIEDALQLEHVVELNDSLQTKAQLEQAFNLLRHFAGVLL